MKFYIFFFAFLLLNFFELNELKCQNSKQHLNYNLFDMKVKGKVKSILKASYSALIKNDSSIIAEALNADIRDKDQQSIVIYYQFNDKGFTESIKYLSKLDTISEPDALEQFIFEKEKLVQSKYIDNIMKTYYSYYYTFDKNKRLTKTLKQKKGTNYFYNYIFKNSYDSLNRVVEVSQFEGTTTLNKVYRYAKFKLKYDSQNNLIEEYAYFPDYKLAYIDKFIYDSLDNVISKKRFFSQKSSPEFEVTYKYKYDNRENWVERIEFFDNTPNYVVTRVINYFLN